MSITSLKDLFELNGIKDKDSLLLARYIAEPQNQSFVSFDENQTVSQKQVIDCLQDLVGHYKVYSDANLINKYNEKIKKQLASCKNTLKETI